MPATSAPGTAPGATTPLRNPLQRAISTWVRLVELGNTHIQRDFERHSSNWAELTRVRSLPELIKHQQAFARSLWSNQQDSLRTAARILREGCGATVKANAAPQATRSAEDKAEAKAEGKKVPMKLVDSAPAAPVAAPVEAPEADKAAPKAAKAAPKAAKAPPKPAKNAPKAAKAMPAAAPAEPAKDSADDAPTAAPRFELYCDKAGEYRFRLKAEDGPVLLRSEGYKARGSALNGINSVRRNAAERKRYADQRSASGKPTFNLKAGNHQVIGSSATFPSVEQMEATIELLQHTAADAELVDLTDEQQG